MNESPSWDEDLRAADPFPTTPDDVHQRNQIFQEITMNRDATPAEASHPDLLERAAANRKKPNRFARPLVAMSAAASVITASVLGFSLLQSPSASAEMLEVAQNTVTVEEGQIVVTAELEAAAADGAELPAELVDELGVVEGTLDFDFDGDDYSFEADIDDGELGFTPQVRLVDGDLYASESGESWYALGADESNGFAQLAAEYVPGVTSFDGAALEQLVVLTDDVTKTEVDGVTTYSGTLETDDILALTDNVPAAVLPFQLAEQQEVPLPSQLQVEMTIVDDRAETISVTVEEYETDGVVVSGTVVTDYSGVGEPQDIVAPPADLIETE